MPIRPLRVVAELAGPLADSGDPPHLDGLLALAWVRRHAKMLDLPRPSRFDGGASLAQEPHLPLARVEWDGRYVWLASAALYDEPKTPAAIWSVKRRDVEDFERLARKVNVVSGPAKNARVRADGLVTPRAVWYAWGDRREVVRALRLIWGRESAPHGQVGSRRRTGSGQILRWRVEEVPELAPESPLVRSGVAARNLPLPWAAGAAGAKYGGVRPPYWHPATMEQVVPPGIPVELLPEVVAACTWAAGGGRGPRPVPSADGR